jgi:hypothetical protein
MTNRKLVFIIVSVVGGVVLIAGLAVGGLVWFFLHSMASSEAADTARSYLRGNEILKSDIGEVKDFGSIVTGRINTRNGSGHAVLFFKVIGERRTVRAMIDLYRGKGEVWRVYSAHYERGDEMVDLMPGTPLTVPTHPVNSPP